MTEEPKCAICNDEGVVERTPAGYGHEDDLAEYDWCECRMRAEIDPLPEPPKSLRN